MGVIYLVRHAQASFGARDYDNLSELGQQQALRLGAVLDVTPELVVSGSMRRHQQTASLAGFTPEIDVGYDEFDHQEVLIAHKPSYKRHAVMVADLARTGNPRRAFQDVFGAATQRWIDGGDGYTETFQAFCDRSEAAVRRTASSLGKGSALVFTSGGPIAAVVGRLLSGGDGLWTKLNPVTINTAITKVVSGRSGLTVVSYNEHVHLGADLLTYR
ncbi:histidine phosphatase family protein [Kribbella sp. NPDC004536]|uniref:histidine phosphatase family protein n=1 Tax=Kribbella sp. NPDC004536 TaxID=3364106 RepID=UPI00369D0F63